MKTLLVNFLLLVITHHVLGDTFFVNIDTNRFSLIFDDASLTEAQRALIMTDLQHEYSTLTNCPIILHDAEEKGYIEFRAYGIKPYDNDIRLPRSYTIDGEDGSRILHVKTALSDRYMVAFALQASHTNAFQSAIPFVESLRAGVLHNMTSNEVSQIFYYERATPEMYAGSRDDLATFLDQCSVLDPGLLCFSLSDQHLRGHEPILVLALPYIDASDNGRHDATTVIWMDNRWKLLLSD